MVPVVVLDIDRYCGVGESLTLGVADADTVTVVVMLVDGSSVTDLENDGVTELSLVPVALF